MAAESALGQDASSGNGRDGRVRKRRAGNGGGCHREEPHGWHSETGAAMTSALARSSGGFHFRGVLQARRSFQRGGGGLSDSLEGERTHRSGRGTCAPL